MFSEYNILDGGFATELVKYGFSVDKDPLWSARVLATSPESVVKVHLDYLKKGANVITTASYQASISGFQTHLGSTVEEAENLIRSSVTLAQTARDDFFQKQKCDYSLSGDKVKPLIAGSVGPYGACLSDGSEYTGNYVDEMSIEELIEWHRPRVQCLVNGGVDIIAFETIPALKEGIAVMLLIREFPDTKAWLSFSSQDCNTCHGEKLSAAVKECLQSSAYNQLLAIGVNCCPPENVEALLNDITQQIKGLQYLPLIAYPNSGEKWISGVGWTGKSSCKPLHSFVEDWVKAGARWIGGCCRTDPDDIGGIAQAIASLKAK